MPLGYHDKILHVDLTSGSLDIEHSGEDFYRPYMGRGNGNADPGEVGGTGPGLGSG